MKDITFTQFNIDTLFINKLSLKKITIPTKIQEEVIPKILNGEDVIAQSKTGTGKTFAYLLPLLQIIKDKKTRVLIVAPTKELAGQIYEETVYMTGNTKIKSVLLISGKAIDRQKEYIKDDIDIIIGVPGRLLKLVNEGLLKLGTITKIVLDEADFLIDLGFLKDIQSIFEYSKNVNQLLVFSATLSGKTKKILDIIHNQKYSVRVDPKNKLPDNIINYFFPISDEDREKTLLNLINIINPFLCIIFVRTKDESKYIYRKLKDNKYLVECLNGALTSSQRKNAINNFKSAKSQYLVATDLASRGLDVESVTHIINYTLPVNELDYLHRAGRTGRMHKEGIVYSICNELDEGYLKKYAEILDFKIKASKFRNEEIIDYKSYEGVKPRFNLNEIKKKEKIREKNNGKKTKRDQKRR